MKTTIQGFPRVGAKRELKFITEKYFRQEVSINELLAAGKELRQKQWQDLKETGLDQIPSNDFSFYDTTLDTAFLLNLIPENVRSLDLAPLDQYFALARGYQGEKGDVHALPMKKWFNTNYHYLVPTIEDTTKVQINGDKIFAEFQEAKDLGIITRPVILGPFTLLTLSNYSGEKTAKDFASDFVAVYQEILTKLVELGAEWVQLDEPALVKDLTAEDQTFFKELYQELLAADLPQILIQTFFGDVRDIYQELVALPVAGIGLDFVEGKQTLSLVEEFGFPEDKLLFAGVINGKNIWRNDYEKTLALVDKLPSNVILSTSSSLLHVPYTTENETFTPAVKKHFAFAAEKVGELQELKQILAGEGAAFLEENKQLFAEERTTENQALRQKIADLTEEDFTRQPLVAERAAVQKAEFQLPLLPTTTIGSFPQTREVKAVRAKFRKNELSEAEYDAFLKEQIANCIKLQEEIGLDVLVHGEFERNDMVEYFGEHLEGYLFSKNAWVQSYGTRCVKPPIIWGDVERKGAITVPWSGYAQSLTKQPVKGMLTGPVTILNWSFPREDLSVKESTLQLALAIQEEVLDLEANGIKIIQIDEAALREKLPLRRTDWYSEYLDWAIPAFRLVHSKVQADTQIHTHMCYSEFTDIIPAIDQMDADVISFEASRSNLAILDALKENNFKTQVGPGIYDIHSPRIPSVEELKTTIDKILVKIPQEKVWINPDCGLKTRGEKETVASLKNLVEATKEARKELA